MRQWANVVLLSTLISAVMMPSPAVIAQTLQTVSLDDALATAVDRHPSIVAAARALEAAQARRTQAKATAALQLSVSSKASVGTLTQGVPTGGASVSTHHVSVEASLLLLDGGVAALQVLQEEAVVEVARAGLDAVRNDVALAAGQAYFQVFRAMRVVEVRDAAFQFALRQVQQAEAFVRAGTGARADVVKAQATAASAEVELLTARGQVEIALAALRAAMGMPLTQMVTVVEVGDAVPLVIAPTEAAAEATARRAEMKRSGAEVRGAEVALRIAEIRAGLAVSVGAGGVVQMTPNPGQAGWAVSVTVSYPLADGGRTKGAVDEARANLAAAGARADATAQQLQLQAFQAAVNARETAARVQATQTSITAAEESLRVSDGRYRAGVGTLFELLDAQTASTQARISGVQARYDLHLAVVTLRHAVGRPLIERRSALRMSA